MKPFKLFLAALALMFATSTFANSNFDLKANRGNITYEIEKMLKDSGLIIEENFTVKVIFSVSQDRKIEIRQVLSPNQEVNDFLLKRLNNQKLHGEVWDMNKIYELPVKVESRR